MFVGMFINLNMAVENSNKFSAGAKKKIREVLPSRFGVMADLLSTEEIESMFTEYVTNAEIEKFREIYGAYYSKDINEIIEHIKEAGIVRDVFELNIVNGNAFVTSILVEKREIENAIIKRNLEAISGII